MSNLDPNIKQGILDWLDTNYGDFRLPRKETESFDDYTRIVLSTYKDSPSRNQIVADGEDKLYLVTFVRTSGGVSEGGFGVSGLQEDKFSFRGEDNASIGKAVLMDYVAPGVYIFELTANGEEDHDLHFGTNHQIKVELEGVTLGDVDYKDEGLKSPQIGIIPSKLTRARLIKEKLEKDGLADIDLGLETTDSIDEGVTNRVKLFSGFDDLTSGDLKAKPDLIRNGYVLVQLTNGDGSKGITGQSDLLTLESAEGITEVLYKEEILPSIYLIEVGSLKLPKEGMEEPLSVKFNDSEILDPTITYEYQATRAEGIAEVITKLKGVNGFPFATQNDRLTDFVDGVTKIDDYIISYSNGNPSSRYPITRPGDELLLYLGIQFFSGKDKPSVIKNMRIDLPSNEYGSFYDAVYYGETEEGIHLYTIALDQLPSDLKYKFEFYETPIYYDGGVPNEIEFRIENFPLGFWYSIPNFVPYGPKWSNPFWGDSLLGSSNRLQTVFPLAKPDGEDGAYLLLRANKGTTGGRYDRWDLNTPIVTEIVSGDPDAKVTPVFNDRFGWSIDDNDYSNTFAFKVSSEVVGRVAVRVGVHDKLRNHTHWADQTAGVEFTDEPFEFEKPTEEEIFYILNSEDREVLKQRIIDAGFEGLELNQTNLTTDNELPIRTEPYILPPEGSNSTNSIVADGKESLYIILPAIDSDTGGYISGMGDIFSYSAYMVQLGFYEYVGELFPGVYVFRVTSATAGDEGGIMINAGEREFMGYERFVFEMYNVVREPGPEEAKYITDSLNEEASYFYNDEVETVDISEVPDYGPPLMTRVAGFLETPKLGQFYGLADGKDLVYIGVQFVEPDLYGRVVEGVTVRYADGYREPPGIKRAYLGVYGNNVHVFCFSSPDPEFRYSPTFTVDGEAIYGEFSEFPFFPIEAAEDPISPVLVKWNYLEKFPDYGTYTPIEGALLVDNIKTNSEREAIILTRLGGYQGAPSGTIFQFRSADGEELVGDYSRIYLGDDDENDPTAEAHEFYFGARSTKEGTDNLIIEFIDPDSRRVIQYTNPITVRFSDDGHEPDIPDVQLERPEVAQFFLVDDEGNKIGDGKEIQIEVTPETRVRLMGFLGYFDEEDPSEPKPITSFVPKIVPSNGYGHGPVGEVEYIGFNEEMSMHEWSITPTYLGLGMYDPENRFGMLIGDGVNIDASGDPLDFLEVRTWIDDTAIPASDPEEEMDDFPIDGYTNFKKIYFSIFDKRTKKPFNKLMDVELVPNEHYGSIMVDPPNFIGDGTYTCGIIGVVDGTYTIGMSANVSFAREPVIIEDAFYITVQDEEKDGPISGNPHNFDDARVETSVTREVIPANGVDQTLITFKLELPGGTGPIAFSNDVKLVSKDGKNIGDAKLSKETNPGEYVFTVVSETEGVETFYVETPSGRTTKEVTVTYGPDNRPPVNCEVDPTKIKIIDKKLSTIKVLPSTDPLKIYHDGFYYLNPSDSPGPWRSGPTLMRAANIDLSTERFSPDPTIDKIEFEINLFEEGTEEPLTGQTLTLMQTNNLSTFGYVGPSKEIKPGVYRITLFATDPNEDFGSEIPTPVVDGGWNDITFANEYSKADAFIGCFYVSEMSHRPSSYFSKEEAELIMSERFNPKAVGYYNQQPWGERPVPPEAIPLDNDGDKADLLPVSADGKLAKILTVTALQEGHDFPVPDEDGNHPLPPPPPPIGSPIDYDEGRYFRSARLEVISGDPEGVVITRNQQIGDHAYYFRITGRKPGWYEVAFVTDSTRAEITYKFKVYPKAEDIVDIIRDVTKVYRDYEQSISQARAMLEIDELFSSYSFTPLETEVGLKGYLDLELVAIDPMGHSLERNDLYFSPVVYPGVNTTPDVPNPCLDYKYLGHIGGGIYRYEVSSDRPGVFPVRMYNGALNLAEMGGKFFSMGYVNLVFRNPALSFEIDPDTSTIVADRYEILADGEDTAIIDVTLYYVKSTENEKPRLAEGIKDVILVSKDGEILGRQTPIGEVKPGVYRFKLTSLHVGDEELTFMTHGEGAGEK